MALSILILAAGQHEADNASPIYLAEHGDMTILERILKKCVAINPAELAICFLKSDIQRFNVDRVAKLLSPDIKIIEIESYTGGSGCTALFGACQAPPQNELMIVSANELVNIELEPALEVFRERQLDGATLIFHSMNPRYSFVKMDKGGRVVEATQQDPISTNATVGLFWYKRAEYFVRAVKQMIIKNARINDRFFIAPAFNEMILEEKYVGVIQINKFDYLPLKNAAQRKLFEEGQI